MRAGQRERTAPAHPAAPATNWRGFTGRIPTFSFDSLNRETAMTDPLGASATYAYDAGSRQTSATDRDGRMITTSYDPLYRVTGQTWLSGGSTVNRLTFTYDAADNQLTAADFSGAYTMGYDALNRMTSEQEPFGLLLTFGYDANDNRTVVQDSFGGVLTSLYDALDRFTSRQFGGVSQTPLRFDLTYNSRNDLSTVTRYSDLAGSNKVGYSTYSYDAADRVTNIQHQNGTGSVLANFTYSYDPGSRLQSEKADGSTRTFQYDPTNELTSDGLFSYSYDLNGNRTVTGYTTGTGNELTGDGTWTYAYDGEGNTISKRNTSTGEVWSYGYDNDNRMLTAKDVSGTGTTMTLATYSYDALGNRLEADVWINGSGTTVTRFGYDGDQVWADLTSSNALQTRYLRGDQEDQLLARISGAGVAAWYLTDWEGSVRKLTDGSGTLQDTITYDGFGNIHSETNSTAGGAYKFDGMRFNAETGDYSTPNRTDAPTVGRWLQQDPSGFAAGDANLYSYIANDSTNVTDPSGLAPKAAQTLKATQVADPVTVPADPHKALGGFIWPISWTLSAPSDAKLGGFIIQHVRLSFSVAGPRSPRSETWDYRNDGNWNYWEAWRVLPNQTRPDPKLRSKAGLQAVIDTMQARLNAAQNPQKPADRLSKKRQKRLQAAIDLFKAALPNAKAADDFFALIPGELGSTGDITFHGDAFYIDRVDPSRLNQLAPGLFAVRRHSHAGSLLATSGSVSATQSSINSLRDKTCHSDYVKHQITVFWNTRRGTWFGNKIP